MKLRNFGIFFCSFIFSVGSMAQSEDCTLGIGGKDTDVIVQVFQLNAEQKIQMETWATEFTIQTGEIETQIQQLFDTHPQKSQEDLERLSEKYKVLKDELVASSREFDKKLIGLFNPKQYERYMSLCNEAGRRPMLQN